MRRIALVSSFVCFIASAAAHAQGVLGDVLRVGATARVWSAGHQLAGRPGVIQDADGNNLRLSYAADTEDVAGTVDVPKVDVDSLHILSQGEWFRASFADPILRRVSTRTAVDSAFAGVAPHTPIRIRSARDSIWIRGTFEGIRRDSVVVLYGTGPGNLTRAFAVQSLDRVKVPGSRISVKNGAKGGFAVGAVAALGYALVTSTCVHEKDGCGIGGVPRDAVAKTMIGGVVGLVAGILAGEASHFVWRTVDLP